ncbi:MAG: VWA domain-containing protein [Desulfamplus sp.]|nr:VWA domain-containing protein [Desulfamplus sp.]
MKNISVYIAFKITVYIMTVAFTVLYFTGCGDNSDAPPSASSSFETSTSSSPQVNIDSRQTGSDLRQAGISSDQSDVNTLRKSLLEWPFIDARDDATELLAPLVKEQSGTAMTKDLLKEEKDALKEDASIANNLIARNFLLIFDGSGSMAELECGAGRRKIEVAKEAVTEWAKTVPDDANLGLVAFYHKMWAELDLGPAVDQRDLFSQQIEKLWASASTPLAEALEKAYEKLTLAGRKQLGYGEYTIVVVTDGIADDPEFLHEYINRILAESPVNIYTIGFCIGESHSLNQPGRTTYRSADNPDELKKGLSQILAESESFDETQMKHK